MASAFFLFCGESLVGFADPMETETIRQLPEGTSRTDSQDCIHRILVNAAGVLADAAALLSTVGIGTNPHSSGPHWLYS